MMISDYVGSILQLIIRWKASRAQIIIIITILVFSKAFIVERCCQHILTTNNQKIAIQGGFGWSDLVENVKNGEYVTSAQLSLRGSVMTESRSLRPPVYVYYLIGLEIIAQHGVYFAILVQSALTTLIALLSYIVVYKTTLNDKISTGVFVVLFAFPMNFVKTGSIDEAPLMLMFVLISISTLIDAKNNTYKYVLAGLFSGMAILTRYSALFAAAGLCVYLLVDRRKWNILVYILGVIICLTPWLVRNYNLYGEVALSAGGSRLLYVGVTEEFANDFPETSIDKIEISVMHRLQKKYKDVISSLDNEVELDRFYTSLAIEQMLRNPETAVLGVFAKLKAFNPFCYYPVRENSIIKRLTYVVWYVGALILLLITYPRFLSKGCSLTAAFYVAIFYCLLGLVMFMTSRHMYPVIVLLYIQAFIGMHRK